MKCGNMSTMTSIEFNQPPSFPSKEKEPVTYIENGALAEDVAYAEKPYRDGAVELKKLPGTEAAVVALGHTATEKGNEVGRQYVAEKQAELDRLRGQFGDASGETAEGSVETETSLERLASEVKQALAEKYKVSPEDFSLFTYEKDGETRNTVVYTGANGIDLGNPKEDYDTARSWDRVMDDTKKNTDRHTIEVTVGGVKLTPDARKGMTYALYDQLVEEAKAAGRPLPDSKDTKITSTSGDWYSWTMMSGEPLTAGGYAPVARVGDVGSVYRRATYRDRGGRYLLFRPAVNLDDLR